MERYSAQGREAYRLAGVEGHVPHRKRKTMDVRFIMSEKPACCLASAPVEDVARLMAEHDCGEIPVVDQQGVPVGTVTDRDIACRVVATGKEPRTPAREAMSTPPITVTADTSLEDCCLLMQQHQIRRVLVVDEKGACCGVVAQADVARRAPELAARLVRQISRSRPDSTGATR
jgi:CBS domain-containing protein